MLPKEILSFNLKRLRELRGETQASLAERASVGVGIIKQAETGASWPSAENFAALAEALGANLSDLLATPSGTPAKSNTSDRIESRLEAIERRLEQMQAQPAAESHSFTPNTRRKQLADLMLELSDADVEMVENVLADVIEERAAKKKSAK